jgi:para-nitrobenzyl esterase
VSGAVHGSEVPFILKSLKVRFGNGVALEDQATPFATNSYFTSFAKTGAPAHAQQASWEDYNHHEAKFLILEFG